MITYVEPDDANVLCEMENEMYGLRLVVNDQTLPVTRDNISAMYYKKANVPVDLEFVHDESGTLTCITVVGMKILLTSQAATDDFTHVVQLAYEAANEINKMIHDITENSWTNC